VHLYSVPDATRKAGSPLDIAGWRGSQIIIATATNRSGSFAPVTSSPRPIDFYQAVGQRPEVLDQTVRQLERGEVSPLELIDTLLTEEFSLRENRRVKMALRMARLYHQRWPASTSRSSLPSTAIVSSPSRFHRTQRGHPARALPLRSTLKLSRPVAVFYFATLADIVGAVARVAK